MKILLGITGSISAYKAVDILRYFQQENHELSVVMTWAATRFITPLTLETFIGHRVYTEMFREGTDPLAHINLVRDIHLLLVAPATANIIGKFTAGIADDLLSSLYLACSAPVVVAPAMNTRMLNHDAVRENLKKLRKRGVGIVEPDSGSLACEEEGKGRLPSAETIYRYCMKKLNV